MRGRSHERRNEGTAGRKVKRGARCDEGQVNDKEREEEGEVGGKREEIGDIGRSHDLCSLPPRPSVPSGGRLTVQITVLHESRRACHAYLNLWDPREKY